MGSGLEISKNRALQYVHVTFVTLILLYKINKEIERLTCIVRQREQISKFLVSGEQGCPDGKKLFTV